MPVHKSRLFLSDPAIVNYASILILYFYLFDSLLISSGFRDRSGVMYCLNLQLGGARSSNEA